MFEALLPWLGPLLGLLWGFLWDRGGLHLRSWVPILVYVDLLTRDEAHEILNTIQLSTPDGLCQFRGPLDE